MSKTLKRVFSALDERCYDMEQQLIEKDEKIAEMHKQICEDMNRRMREGNAMIGNVLKACLGGGDIKEMGAGAAVVLDRVRNMNTIEEVKEYVNKLIKESANGHEETTTGRMAEQAT